MWSEAICCPSPWITRAPASIVSRPLSARKSASICANIIAAGVVAGHVEGARCAGVQYLIVLGLLPRADGLLGALKLIAVWVLVQLAGATAAQLIARAVRRKGSAA